MSPRQRQVEPLLQALKGFWGETDYKDIEKPSRTDGVYFDEGKDKAAPLYARRDRGKGRARRPARADQRRRA